MVGTSREEKWLQGWTPRRKVDYFSGGPRIAHIVLSRGGIRGGFNHCGFNSSSRKGMQFKIVGCTTVALRTVLGRSVIKVVEGCW